MRSLDGFDQCSRLLQFGRKGTLQNAAMPIGSKLHFMSGTDGGKVCPAGLPLPRHGFTAESVAKNLGEKAT